MDHLRIAVLAGLSLVLAGSPLRATVVRFETSLGNFDIRLFDTATPLTADNLLAYVNANRYDGSFIHRSVPNFIIQGGGYRYDAPTNSAPSIEEFPSVDNEPGISNIRGTLAMAKLGNDPDSATSEWFPNLAHNTENLDSQNGGFTVFAAMLGNGMQVADAIAALPRFDIDGAGSTFNTVPLRPGSGLANRLVFITDAYVLDVPEGDYDLDGTVNGVDLAIWSADYGRLKLIGGDFNDDKEMNGADLAIWENGYGDFTPSQGTFARYTDGDSDGDGVVNGIDFLNWQRGAGGTTDVASDGDGNAQISGMDFLLWQRNYGTILPVPVAPIPEPTTAALLLLGLLAATRAQGRSGRRI